VHLKILIRTVKTSLIKNKKRIQKLQFKDHQITAGKQYLLFRETLT
jgi:hypothetical protein